MYAPERVVSHNDDNTGYKPQEARGEPQVDAGVADDSADVKCLREKKKKVFLEDDLQENEPLRMLRWS